MNFLEKLFYQLERHYSHLNRITVIWYFAIWLGTLLVGTTFWYTILDHTYYKELADKQQTMTIRNPVSRGSIYSIETNGTPKWVFAVSTDLWDLAIWPKEIGSKTKLEDFLTDILFSEFCNEGGSRCLERVGKYIREDLIEREQMTVTEIREKLKTYLHDKINKPYIDFVLVAEHVTIEATREIQAWKEPSLSFILDNLYVDPTIVLNPDALAAKLSEKLGITLEAAQWKLEKRAPQYLKVLQKMSINTRDRINERIANEKLAIKKWELTPEESIYQFFILESHPTRFYPERTIGGQIMGFMDNNNIGRYGVEGYFDEELQWKNFVQKVKKDNSWRTIDSENLTEFETKNGIDIVLTIDRNIQKELSAKLAKAVKDHRANKGSIIVMNPKTGAIEAMVNYPDYDPNEFAWVYDMEKLSYARYANPGFDLLWVPLFVEDTKSGTLDTVIDGKNIQLRKATEFEINTRAIPKYKYKNLFGPGVYVNDIVGSLYEPGSVFKAITTAIGLDTGEINPTDVYYDKWYVEIDRFKIKNVASQCTGRHSYIHALNWSCNTGMIDIVQKIGKSLFHKYIHDFWFGSKSNITLEWEVFAKIDPYEKWSRTQFFTMSFWQGINVTQLQMAAAYAVLANGGIYMQPYIVDKITYPDGRVVETNPLPLRRVIKEETSKKITAMLVDWVRHGFAKAGWVPGYDVAGKTGTSQIASKGWYEIGAAGHTITSYGWFGPASNPRFVLIVRLERPRSAMYAETTASALFWETAEYLLNYYKIPKNQ